LASKRIYEFAGGFMDDGNNWGALLVMWLLGAPVVGALVSVMIDGTRRRDMDRTPDRGPPVRDAMPPVR
jgi:hypothetical protein